MNPNLTCYHCHQKTVGETTTGDYACATCGKRWTNLQDFIRSHFDDLSLDLGSAKAQPVDAEPPGPRPVNGASSPKSWLEHLRSASEDLLFKLVVQLLKFVPKLILRLVIPLIATIVSTVLLALITYSLLLCFNLCLKARGHELSPERRAALQTAIHQTLVRLVFGLSMGLILAAAAWVAGWAVAGVISGGLAGLMVGFWTWPALRQRAEKKSV